MQPSIASPARRHLARLVDHPRFLSLTLSLSAAATAAGGISCLIAHGRSTSAEHVLAPAGIILLTMSLAQFRIAWLVWPKQKKHAATSLLQGWTFLQLLVLGSLLAYFACLAIGPVPYIAGAWLTAVVVCYTLLLLPLAASPKAIERWRKWMQGHAPRRFNWLVYASVLLIVGAEAGLQSRKLWQGRALSWREPALKSADADVLLAMDGEQTGDRAGRLDSLPFRVVVLGDDLERREPAPNDYLSRIEQMLPGIEVVPVSMSGPSSSGSPSDLAARLSQARPDLVLSVVAACKQLAHAPQQSSWFDWRQFELARQLGWGGDAATPLQAGPTDFESLLGELSAQLAVCRTPMDDPMRERWQQTFDGLDTLAAICARHRFPLAVVAVPAEFQVNPALCDTLARRLGYSREQLDLELPQRKLAGFAESRKLPLVDLLPSLRLCRQSPYERNAAVLNDHGNTTVATALGGWLESRYGGQLTVARLSKAR